MLSIARIPVSRSKGLACCFYELHALCKEGLLILDISTSSLWRCFCLCWRCTNKCLVGHPVLHLQDSTAFFFFFFNKFYWGKPNPSTRNILRVRGCSVEQLRYWTLKAEVSLCRFLWRHWSLIFCDWFFYLLHAITVFEEMKADYFV